MARGQDDHGTPEPNDRARHPDYVRTAQVRVRIRLVTGIHCIGDIHVSWPDGRVSDVLNDSRDFIPLTNAVMEGDNTYYDFLTVAKSQVALAYEFRREGEG